MDNMWNQLNVKLNFLGRLCGSVPMDKDLIETWINARKSCVQPPVGKTITQITEEVLNRLPDIDEENKEIEIKTMVGFEQVENKLAVRAATIRAHIKDCASQIQNQFVGRIKGERNFTTKIKNGIYITGGYRNEFGTEMIFILKNGVPVTKWDGLQDRLIHAKTPTGQINALKRFAYILKPTLEFTIRILGNSVKQEDLETILQYGGVHGYGGERSQQEGQYTFEIKKYKDKGDKNEKRNDSIKVVK